MTNKRKFFGTDGVRGRFNQHPMTTTFAHAFGAAVVTLLQQQGIQKPFVCMGRDTRSSGIILGSAFAAGASSMGARVESIGVVPTPGIAWSVQTSDAHLGVVISASHNPYFDNGIKLFGADGFKLLDEHELEIELLIEQYLQNGIPFPDVDDSGSIELHYDKAKAYLKHLQQQWTLSNDLSGVSIVVDCANGAATPIAQELFESLGATVHMIGNQPNGTNINQNCGALHPEELGEIVAQKKAAIGIALDGDADRLIVVDEQGAVVDGDQIIALCATQMSTEDNAPKTIVATVMSNLGLDAYLSSLGIHLERTQVGDKYVMQKMKEKKAWLGGEQSGHLIFLQHATTGDGLLASLYLLQLLQKAQKPLSSLASMITKFPQVLKNVKVREKKPWLEIPNIAQVIQQVEQELGDKGRVLVRYSGTENKARVMVEGQNEQQVQSFVDWIVTEFEKSLGVNS